MFLIDSDVVNRNSSRFLLSEDALAGIITFLFQGYTIHYCHLCDGQTSLIDTTCA